MPARGGLTLSRDGCRPAAAVCCAALSLAAACRCGAETEPWDEAGETAAMREKGANPAYVQKVASGAFRRARVSWWGFDAADSTRFVQAAIDSGVPALTLDRMDSAWQVTPVVIRRQDFTLTFEDGATLLAKEGAFLPIDDKLLTVTASTNVTLNGRGVLRMRRDDYKKAPYVKAEWRHCLIIGESRRVMVDGLRMEESGGDGITLGTGAEGVTIRNCVCDRNFRQGISVCSARDLLIENCALVNTGGTAPAAGIDFEPDYDGLDEVANCVMRNCVITNNQGSGIDVCLNNLSSAGSPVSLLIEGCLCDRNSSGTTVRYSRTDQCVPGEVVYRDCTFSRSWSCGIGFERKSADAFDVRFERCRIEDCGSGASGYEIDFFPPNWAARIADGIVFDDVGIRQKWRRPWLGVENANFADRPKAISGRVFVTDPGGAVTTNVITSSLLAAAFPPDGEPPLPRYELDYREVTLVDDSEGVLTPLAPVAFQSRVCIDFYVAKAGRVRFVMKQNASRPEDVAQTLAGHVHARFDPTFYQRIDIPGMEAEEVAFDVPNGGWYLLWVSPGYKGPLQIVSANCPVAVNLCEGPVSLRAAAETADVWLDAPKQGYPFTPLLLGPDGGGLSFSMTDSAGATVAALVSVPARWTPVAVPRGTAEGLVRTRFAFASSQANRSVSFDVTGIPGYLFLSPTRYWHWSGIHRTQGKEIPDPGVAVSGFGYDPEDSTAFVQAALDSGVRKLVLDRQSGPWRTGPLTVRSNTELVLESGVELVARQDAFQGTDGRLLTLDGVANVTLRGGVGSALRMWREGGDALLVRAATNVAIEGLRFVESGGNGICVERNSRDVTIRRCTCDGSRLQGLAVRGAESLFVEDLVVSAAAGASPLAGIGLEPDSAASRLTDCVFRNCLSENNAGNGYGLSLDGLTASSEPVSILFENCRSVGNRNGAAVSGAWRRAVDFVRGDVTFRHCSFEESLEDGISVQTKPKDAFALTFANCTVVERREAVSGASVYLGRALPSQPASDAVCLSNLCVRQAHEAAWFRYGSYGVSPAPSGVEGTVTVCRGAEAPRTVVLDDAWRETNMPTHSEPVFLNLRPKVSSFWHTAPGESFDVPVNFPEGARSATLRVTGSAGTRTYANIVDTSCTVRLPVVRELRDEDVYTLTLTFDNGVERTAVLGQVTGWSRGDAGVTRCLSPEDEAWCRAEPRSVLPIPCGTRSLTVDGETVDPGLDGAQGWYALRRRAGSQVVLELETDKERCEASLMTEGPAGLLLMLR